MSILSDLQTKKLGLFELLAIGFNLYLKHFRTFLSLLLLTLPFTIVIQILPPNSSNLFFAIFALFYFLIVVPVYTIAFSIVTERYILGEKPELKSVLRRVLSRLLPLTSLNIKFGIIYFLRCLLLLVPGIIYLVNNGYFGLAFILRDQRGKAAFQYSRALVKGNWWKVFFFYLLIFFLIPFGIQAFMSRILSSVIANSPILVTILSSTLVALISLGVGISSVLLFLNLDFQKR